MLFWEAIQTNYCLNGTSQTIRNKSNLSPLVSLFAHINLEGDAAFLWLAMSILLNLNTFCCRSRNNLNTNHITLLMVCQHIWNLTQKRAKGDHCFCFLCFGMRCGLVATGNICFSALGASHCGSIFCQTSFAPSVSRKLILFTSSFSAKLWIIAVMIRHCYHCSFCCN